MLFKLSAIVLAIAVSSYSIGQNNYDLQFTNIRFSNDDMLVDVQMRAPTGDINSIGQDGDLTSINLEFSYDNRGTGAGQMIFNNSLSTLNSSVSSDYFGGTTEPSNGTIRVGFGPFSGLGRNGGLVLSTTYVTVATIVFDLGAGTNNTHDVTFTWLAGTTKIEDDAGISQNQNTLQDASNQALPVSWMSFDLELKLNRIVLNWTSSTEENNEGFEIQRSYDGMNYETFGWVNGNGNSLSPIDYNYTDYTVDMNAASTVFYRLKQIDFDGKYEFSPVRSISLNSTQSISWFPNPARENIIVNTNETAIVEIYDMSGRTVITSNTLESNSIDVSRIEMGTYLMIIKNMNGEVISQDKLHIK